ncbi:MAG: chemotaxis protein CheW [Roseburia sp.]
MQLLTFSLGQIVYGMPVTDVESIETRMNILKIPDSPQFIEGIMNLHGDIVPVYNLAARFGNPNERIDNIIVANVAGMKVGLEVGQVREIIDAGKAEINPMPQLMNSTQNFFRDVVSKNKMLIGILDVNSLITQEEREGIRKLIDDNKNQGEK